jgi:hypothetical protein
MVAVDCLIRAVRERLQKARINYGRSAAVGFFKVEENRFRFYFGYLSQSHFIFKTYADFLQTLADSFD